jgi:hypothetical protein
MLRAGRSRHECMSTLGLTEGQFYYQQRVLRRAGAVPPRQAMSGDAWADDRARCGAGPKVGSRADLLDAIGVDTLRLVAAECPPGVTLMTWIAGIVKDALNDDPVPSAAPAVCQLDARAARGSAEA